MRIRLLLVLAILSIGTAAHADRPLVIESGTIKQLPSGTSLNLEVLQVATSSNLGAATASTLNVSGLMTISGGITGLPVTNCAAGQSMTASSTTGTGTCSANVSAVTAGTGISASTTSGTATVAVNLTGGSCPAGQVASALNSTGTLTCTAIGTQGGTTGTGTTNQAAKWTGAASLGAGWAGDNGTTWGVSGKLTIDEATGNLISGGTIGENIAGASPADAEGWALWTKPSPLTFPVPTIRPTQANTVIALDVMPNGTPTIGTGGFAWIDTCDGDFIANNSVVARCIRIGANGNMTIDSQAFNGATQSPIDIDIAGTNVIRIGGSLITQVQPLAISLTSWVNKPFVITDTGAGGSVGEIDNTSASTAAFSAWTLTNDASTGASTMYAFGTAWTTSGALMQDSTVFYGGAGMSNGVSIAAAATTGQVRVYAGGSANANEVERFTPKAHINVGASTAPTLSAGCTSGTGSAIIGTDTDFAFTTGSTSTACTVTFAQTYTSKPIGECFPEGTTTPPTCTWSATALTCTTNASATTYNCHVKGQNGGT